MVIHWMWEPIACAVVIALLTWFLFNPFEKPFRFMAGMLIAKFCFIIQCIVWAVKLVKYLWTTL